MLKDYNKLDLTGNALIEVTTFEETGVGGAGA
jgi:hypothetical protein